MHIGHLLFHKLNTKTLCPVCRQKVPWAYRRNFSGWLGQRRSAPCPYCQNSLTWDKTGHHLIISGGLLMLLVVVFAAGPVQGEQAQTPAVISFAASLGLLVTGYVKLRLVTAK